ncbi:BppU family phage baseplate upper protein [Mammaliicoccus sciuri]|uniref:BppU family phage baseplate upper protein n=1 Tax=Mammaliicoccus sciuri TaxID=1296 RepID=UPI003F887901
MVNFDAAPNKVAELELETTAKYQPRANLDVAFSSMDRESAIFKFQITQNKLPLSIGSSNVKTHILLVHQNGSKVYSPLTITDALNGVAQYKLENEMLKMPGKVTAQVYVTRRGKDIQDSSYAVVAERIFTFTIEESLGWSFDGETKLNYIVEIDELIGTLESRINTAISAVENAENYVELVNEAKVDGITDIEIAKTNSISELNALTLEKTDEIRNLGNEYIGSLETINNEMNTKMNDFISNVSPENYAKLEDTETWQKFKLTNDDGTVELKDVNNDLTTLQNLTPGNYYVSNMPITGATSTAGFLEKTERDELVKRITFKPYNSTQIWVMRFYNTWSDWELTTKDMETTVGAQEKVTQAFNDAKAYIDSKFYDTGWQQLPLMSGVYQDDTLGPSGYRVKNGVCTIIFNLRMSAATTETPFLKLPDEYSPLYAFSFLARTNGTTNGKNPVRCSYDMINQVFKIWQDNLNSIQADDYVYGYVTFLVEG